MFHLINLVSQEIRKGILPWDFKPATPIPEEVRADKGKRHDWITRPATEHCVYTFNVGVNENCRITRPKGDGEGNPIYSTHALVADYDAHADEEMALGHAKQLPYVPNWIEKTLSGNYRYVWLLEKPLRFPSFGFAQHFFEKFAEFGFDVSRGMVGFDRGAWTDPARLWTNGCDWRKVHDKPIPENVSQGWVVQASESFKFTDEDFGPTIPLEDIKPELAKKYPRFSDWPDDFVLGSQGPTFWVDASASPKSAIVRKTGMQTFSAHAPRTFYRWADLLGIAFVKNYEAAEIGRIVKDIFYDGHFYWRLSLAGEWLPDDKSALALHLKTDRKVSAKPNKQGNSQLEKTLSEINNTQRVSYAAPFVYNPSGIIIRNRKRILNTSTLRVIAPADAEAVWGEKGYFPWLSKFLDKLFDTEIQKRVLLAWAARAYQGAYHQSPTSGQILFIAGPVGVGKTLLNRGILAELFGGFAEAGPFLLGEDNFNGELFNVGYWAVDDNDATVDAEKKRKWTSALKRVAANPTFRCNEKFKQAGMSEWQGRLGVTLNADEESIQLLPDLSQSILDKLILLRTASKPPCIFPESAAIKKTLSAELPWFARWLLDHKIPEEFKGLSRFGVKEYAEPSLLDTANQSSQVAGFTEILADWKADYFTIRAPEAKHWEGTSHKLFKELSLDWSTEKALRNFHPNTIGKHLSSLKNKGAHIENFNRGTLRMWRIFPDVPLPETTEN